MDSFSEQNNWYHEGQVSKKLVEYLKARGYTISKDNSDRISARGADIIADIQGEKEIIEVKGYPTTVYMIGKDKGKQKRTDPKLQAKHWFSEALLSSIFNYQQSKEKYSFNLALAFPLIDRYKELIGKVEDFFTDYNISIKVYFIDMNGTVTIDNLNRNER